MKHLGNVTKINGADVEPVDIITFGSPCQDLSVAGKRAGIQDGERSNLFFEAVRIIKEMRESTNGEYPKYAVWENVPGAFSSNKGRDFHAVLEALCSVCDDTVSIPEPYDSKRTKLVWNKAGEIVGDNYSIAWRTLDAQYWGVPQRRKRIYLVADFTSQRAGEILFKPESLRGDLSQGNEAGQGSSADAVGGVDGSVGVECIAFAADKASTLRAGAGAPKHMADILGRLVVLNDQGGSSINVESEEISPTLRANSHQHEPVIAMATQQGGAEVAENLCPTITAAAGMSGNNQPVIAFAQNQREEVRDLGDKAGALAAEAGVHQQTYVAQPVIALQANGIDRADTAGCNGAGWRENESYTLNTVDRHAVCYGIDHVITTGGNCTAQGDCVYEDIQATLKAGGVHAVCYDARGNGDGETACTITGDHQNRITDYTAVAVQKAACFQNTGRGWWNESETAATVRTACGGDSVKANLAVQETLCFDETQITSPANGNNPQWNEPSHPLASTARPPTVICKQPPRRYIIRRLTPTECARLQGFPDKWGWLAPYDPADAEFWEDVRKTYAEINGKKYKPVKNIKKWYDKLHTDGAEYKMWGNGIALPNARYVLHGIAEQGAKTLASLFDGSGGFPLAGVMNGITPVWASEVEPYPIAVTKSRFKEVGR